MSPRWVPQMADHVEIIQVWHHPSCAPPLVPPTVPPTYRTTHRTTYRTTHRGTHSMYRVRVSPIVCALHPLYHRSCHPCSLLYQGVQDKDRIDYPVLTPNQKGYEAAVRDHKTIRNLSRWCPPSRCHKCDAPRRIEPHQPRSNQKLTLRSPTNTTLYCRWPPGQRRWRSSARHRRGL